MSLARSTVLKPTDLFQLPRRIRGALQLEVAGRSFAERPAGLAPGLGGLVRVARFLEHLACILVLGITP